MSRLVSIFIISLFALLSCEKEAIIMYKGEGKVVDSETGLAVDSALISLYQSSFRLDPIQSTYTDSKGNFNFAPSDESKERMTFTIAKPPYYFPETYNFKPDGSNYQLSPKAVLRFSSFFNLRSFEDTSVTLVILDKANYFKQLAGFGTSEIRSNVLFIDLKGEHDYELVIKSHDRSNNSEPFRTDSISIRIPYRDTLAYLYAPIY